MIDTGCRIDSAGRHGRIGFEQEIAIANKTRGILGSTPIVFGSALLVLNALDHVLRWNRMDSSVPAIGLMLAVIGGGLLRRTKEAGSEQKG